MSYWLGRLAQLSLLLLHFASAEWIEIPQFSDQQKVYRMPQSRPQHHHHHHHHHHRVQQQHGNRRIYLADDRYGQPTGFQQDGSLRNISLFSGNHHSTYPHGEQSFDGTISTFTTERIISSVGVGIDPDEGIAVESIEDDESKYEEIPVLYSSIEDVTTTYNSNTAVTIAIPSSTESPKPSKPPPDRDESGNDKGFFDYLPVDLLKRVHKTLKSQPPTLLGKIRFLKAFERTLIEEIENRLSKALAPARKTRGARGHHHEYHDEHDSGIGFPSLEGALMAISFLTFAVYLVRLVMLLFRNAGNGAAPIIIGRKKRSIDEYSEQSARILNYLDSSSEQYYKSQRHFSRVRKSF